MAQITQAPSPLALSGVVGNPFGLVLNITATDSENNPIPWADLTGWTVQLGGYAQSQVPTISSPESGQLSLQWTAAQTLALSGVASTWSLSVTISGYGPLTILAGSLQMTSGTQPGSGTNSGSATLAVAVGATTVAVTVYTSSGGAVALVTAGGGTITIGGGPANPTVKVTPDTFDAYGAAATAQSNAESFATSAVGVETSRAETAEGLKLAKASNLSDLADEPTAITNLA